ncbi:MAG TPA: hypothetical protein VGS27_34140 [Candidatus Sulfotelmatobacter sp.]|nr:hypothetical protein [Candidatus Sulfotelmatobacter sp.]
MALGRPKSVSIVLRVVAQGQDAECCTVSALRLLTVDVDFDGDDVVALPSVDAEVKTAGIDDGHVYIGGGGQGFSFWVQGGEEGSDGGGREDEMLLLRRAKTLAGGDGAGDVDVVSGMEIEAGVGPETVGFDSEGIVLVRLGLGFRLGEQGRGEGEDCDEDSVHEDLGSCIVMSVGRKELVVTAD